MKVKKINVVEIIKGIKNEGNPTDAYLSSLFDAVEEHNGVKIDEINLVGDFITGITRTNNMPFTFYWGRKHDGSDHITVSYNSSGGFDGFNKVEKERFKKPYKHFSKCLS